MLFISNETILLSVEFDRIPCTKDEESKCRTCEGTDSIFLRELVEIRRFDQENCISWSVCKSSRNGGRLDGSCAQLDRIILSKPFGAALSFDGVIGGRSNRRDLG